MLNEDIKKIIINLPEIFKSSNKSIYDLLNDSGYFQMYEHIDKDEIYNELKNDYNYISKWMMYSDDKRTNTGYYFKENANNEYIIGYIDENGNDIIVESSHDPYTICSLFIKLEIESIRKRK